MCQFCNVIGVLCVVFISEAAYFMDSPCGQPPSGKQSVFTFGKDKYGRIQALYECKPSFKAEKGDNISYCLNNNSWSGKPLICEDAINCIDEYLPCQNNGSCLELEPSFMCGCKGRFFGSLCEEADGNWGSWMAWSNCSATCSTGVRIKIRKCNNPAPTKKGSMCQGKGIEVRYCDERSCPAGMYRWCGNETDRCGQQSGRAFCSYYENNYKCTCLEGVKEKRDKTENFIECEDIDECKTRSHTCDVMYATCTNTYGTFTCSCKTGYSGDGTTCNDIDECGKNLHNCDLNAKCYNQEGSYLCKCNEGFRSVALNNTGYLGECKESRLIPFGEKVNEKLVLTSSRGTGERVSKLLEIPTLIPLEDKAGNVMKCKSVYATENGVLVITNLSAHEDNEWKASFRNPSYNFSVKLEDHICALIAPLWTDSQSGQMWYNMYNMQELKEKESKNEDYSISGRIADIFPKDFDPHFVVVVTWDKMKPPWPSANEEMTFQIVFGTDGTQSNVMHLYEDGFMTWQPVYDVPNDISNYQAIAGYFINGQIPVKRQHPSSGKWQDNKGFNIYRLSKETFNSTKQVGRDAYTLTPSIKRVKSPGVKCYEWHLQQSKVADLTLINSCPPNLEILKAQEYIMWERVLSKESEVTCYKWKFRFDNGGYFECCYKKNVKSSPLIAGVNAINKRSGIYTLNRTEDSKMKDVCCNQTRSNYFCLLYAQSRPPTTYTNYAQILTAKGKSGVNFVSFTGRYIQLQGHGEVELLNFKQEVENNHLRIIARIQDDKLTAIALNIENVTTEFSSLPTGIECFSDEIPCSLQNSASLQVNSSTSWIGISTKNGLFINVTHDKQTALEFIIQLPSNIVANVSSGILSKKSKCYVTMLDGDGEAVLTECDLQSIAATNNKPIELESFFTTYPSESGDKPYLDRPMDLTYRFPDINADEANALALSTGSYKYSSPAEVTAVVMETPSSDYEVTINITEVKGDISVLDHENIKNNKLEGSLTFRSKNLNSLENLTLVVNNSDGFLSLLHPNILNCTCKSNHGRCVKDKQQFRGPFMTQTGCLCFAGYTGIDCKEKVKPCSENPCFVGVSCKENIDLILSTRFVKENVTKGYICGDCPLVFDRGNGETCFYNNPCLQTNNSNVSVHKCANAECIPTPGGYYCRCSKGFRKSHQTDTTCNDVDECSEGHECDVDNGNCHNIEGSYYCSCKDGFVNKENTGKCIDKNECLNDNGGCARRCENTQGSFRCVCEVGYKLHDDGRSCTEVDECNLYAETNCSQICKDDKEGEPFYCSCHPRFRLADNYVDCIPLFTTSLPTTTTIEITTTAAKTTTTVSLPTTSFKSLETSTTLSTMTTEQQKLGTTTTTTMKTESATLAETTAPPKLNLFDGLGINNSIKDWLMSLPEFMNLSREEKLAVIALITALSKMLEDKNLANLLMLMSRLIFEDNEVQQCHKFKTVITNSGTNIKNFQLKDMAVVFRRHKDIAYLNLNWDITRLFGKPLFEQTSMILKPTIINTKIINGCIVLWQSVSEKDVLPKRKTSIERRDATGQITTVSAITDDINSKMLIPPLTLVWIIIVVVLVATAAFILLIVGTHVCFYWHKSKALAEKEKKRREKRKYWPRAVVIPHERFQNTLPSFTSHSTPTSQSSILSYNR